MTRRCPRLWRTVLAAGLGLLAVTSSCECDDDLVEIPEPSCKLDTKCSANQVYRYGKCVSTYCDVDDECCPGSYCSLASHGCLPNTVKIEYECRSDLDCFERFQDPALLCALEAEAEVGSCRYETCRTDADCAFGRACFKGWCVAQAPCGGVCPAGQVCEVGTNVCHPVSGQTGCDQTCDPGSLLVIADPGVMVGDVCCPIECGCAVLPSLQPGVFGRFASTAIGVNQVLVSAYDETFGDLVVAHFTTDGDYRGVEYVDGVPASGALGGDPAGPRHGIVTPGPDVGRYTSMVVNGAGEPRVAYYDADNGDLRVAIYSLEAKGWATHVVDDERDAGRYASLIIDPDSERLRISYMVSGLTSGSRPASAVRVATSSSSTPQTAQDWSVATVEQLAQPSACAPACGASDVCVWSGEAPICLPSSVACSPECASGQVCVNAGGRAACGAVLPPDLDGLPVGVGLFTSLAHAPGGDVLVYYDSINGDLRGARVGASGPQAPVLIDGDGVDGRRAGDVGRFPSAAWDASRGELAIAYEDVSSHRLLYYHGAALTGGVIEVIEDGSDSPPGTSFIGADAALAVLPDGAAFVVYQDASYMDLALARRDSASGVWRVERLLADGAYGFDAAIAVTPNVVYAASAAPRLDARRQLASRLLLFLRPL